MECAVRPIPSGLTIDLVGRVNFEETGALRDEIKNLLAVHDGMKLMIINLKEVSSIDSSGLGLLVAARNSLQKEEIKLRLVGVSGAVKKVFEQTNLLVYFEVFETEQEAQV